MRLLFKMKFPVETVNSLARAGVVGQKVGAIVEATKPERIYFTGNGSGRGAVAVYDLEDGSQIPVVAEPWMLTLNAQIAYDAAMTPEELGPVLHDHLPQGGRLRL